MQERLFARIVDRQVVEFPITQTELGARNASAEVYVECYYAGGVRLLAEDLAPYEKIIETPTLFGPIVTVTQTVVKKSLTDLYGELTQIAIDNGGAISPALVGEELFSAFEVVVKDIVQARLDNLARQRGYDHIVSMCSYQFSPIAKYAKEAEYGISVRDTAWASLYQTFQEIRTGLRPIPTTEPILTAMFPAVSWADFEESP